MESFGDLHIHGLPNSVLSVIDHPSGIDHSKVSTFPQLKVVDQKTSPPPFTGLWTIALSVPGYCMTGDGWAARFTWPKEEAPTAADNNNNVIFRMICLILLGLVVCLLNDYFLNADLLSVVY
jgi:hypothetical protein